MTLASEQSQETTHERETAALFAVLEAHDARIGRLERAVAQLAAGSHAVAGPDRLRRTGKTALAEIMELYPPPSPGFGAPGWANERR